MSGSELATICMSRIAMNMPMAMAMKPTQVLMPTTALTGVGITIGLDSWRIAALNRAARCEHTLLNPDASRDQREVQRGKRRRYRNGSKGQGQYGDLSDHHQVIWVPAIAEWAGSNQGGACESDNPRRPIFAKAEDYPNTAELKQGETSAQPPNG